MQDVKLMSIEELKSEYISLRCRLITTENYDLDVQKRFVTVGNEIEERGYKIVTEVQFVLVKE